MVQHPDVNNFNLSPKWTEEMKFHDYLKRIKEKPVTKVKISSQSLEEYGLDGTYLNNKGVCISKSISSYL